MTHHVARRRAAAATAAFAVAVSSLVAGGLTGAASAAPERTASTATDTTYLKDTLGLSETDTRVETVTYDRFQWLLQQPGQFVFVVGSPSDDFKAKVQAADAAAKTASVKRIYWFDPNLSGYTGTKNLDTRNPSGITVAAAAQTIYGNTWKNVLGQYLGNGIKVTGAGTGTITTAADDTVVNDAAGPLWDYRTVPANAPIAASDNAFFVYDKDNLAAGVADKIVDGVNLTTDANANTKVAAALTSVGANSDRVDQFEWWKAENNRRLASQNDAVRYGSTVLDDSDKVDGWKVQQLTYPELIHVLEVKDTATTNFAFLFGGTWCPNTRAVIKDVNKQAQLNDTTVYNWDTVLDGGVVGGGTTSANNPIQVRNNANYQTSPNYVPSYLFGDLVRKYLRNITTEYDPNTGTRVLFYPGGDTTVAADVVRRLQVPFLFNYQRGTGTNPSSTAIKRQWIQQNTDASTGLPTFKEYMTQFWFARPENTRIGLSTTQLPLELAIPADALNAPDTAFLTAAEKADATLTPEQKTALVAPRRSAVTSANANVAFGQEAVANVKRFFGGLPGAVVSTQTLTAPTVAYGTAPTVTVAIENPYGRVPAGQASLTVDGETLTVAVAQNAAAFTLPKLAPGTYPLTATYAGDDQVLAFEKTGSLTVGKANVSSATGSVTKAPTATGTGTYKVTVGTPAGLQKAAGNVTVTFAKGAVTKKATAAVVAGTANVTVPKLESGSWKATIAYAGDARYLAKNGAGQSFTVAKSKVTKATGAVAKAPTSKKSGKYKVSVSTPAGLAKATGKVTITITKGKVTKKVTGTVKAGVVTVTVPKLAKGTWKVSVSYAGDAQYVSAKGAGKSISVKK